MGGRGSSGGKGGGKASAGGGASDSSLSKQIESISNKKSPMSRDDFIKSYRYYNSLNDADLIKAKNITEKEAIRLNKIQSDFYLEKQGEMLSKVPTKNFQYIQSSKEYKEYLKAERKQNKLTQRLANFSSNLRIAESIIENRNKK